MSGGKIAQKIVLTVAIATIILVGRLYLQSATLYHNALQLEEASLKKLYFWDNYKLIMTYEKACHLYFPLSPYYKKSLKKLEFLGNLYENKGKTKLAKYAWLAAKGCIMVNRSFYIPFKGELKTINKHIAKLYDDPRALERDNIKDPDLVASIFLLIGLFTWTGSVIFMILTKDKVKAKISFVTFVLGYMIWIISILKL